MSDTTQQGPRPRRFDEAISRAFGKYSDVLHVREGRPSRRGINTRYELDNTASNEILEIRELIDALDYDGTYEQSGSQFNKVSDTLAFNGYPNYAAPFYIKVSGDNERFIEYSEGDTIEIVDSDSTDQQNHSFFQLVDKDVNRYLLKLEAHSDTPEHAAFVAPKIYRAFCRQMIFDRSNPVVNFTEVVEEYI